MILEFRVFGLAQSKGSVKAFTPKGWSRPILTSTNRNLKSWQQLVSDRANDAIAQLPPSERALLLDGVRLTVAFYLPRPKSLAKRVTAHTKAPDLDKYVRGLCDALTRVVFQDDAQICDFVGDEAICGAGRDSVCRHSRRAERRRRAARGRSTAVHGEGRDMVDEMRSLERNLESNGLDLSRLEHAVEDICQSVDRLRAQRAHLQTTCTELVDVVRQFLRCDVVENATYATDIRLATVADRALAAIAKAEAVRQVR